jgi:hypothetical protein
MIVDRMTLLSNAGSQFVVPYVREIQEMEQDTRIGHQKSQPDLY